METNLAGIVTAIHTPMDPDGRVNLDAIPRLADFALASGVDGVFVCGTTGEFASLSVEERRDVAEAFAWAVDGQAPLIVHVGHNCLSSPQSARGSRRFFVPPRAAEKRHRYSSRTSKRCSTSSQRRETCQNSTD